MTRIWLQGGMANDICVHLHLEDLFLREKRGKDTGDDKQSLSPMGPIIFSIFKVGNPRDGPQSLVKDHVANKCGSGIHTHAVRRPVHSLDPGLPLP